MANKYLTLQERMQIESMEKEGFSLQEIANKLSRGRTTIRLEFKRCAKLKYSALEAQKDFEQVWAQRASRLTRRFSDKDLKLIEEGMSLQKTRNTIRKELKCSFFRMEKWFEENAPTYRGGEVRSLDRRISNIEQQLEIVIDILKTKGV